MSSTVPTAGELDRWVEVAKKCEYLPENDLKVRRELRGALIRTGRALCLSSVVPI